MALPRQVDSITTELGHTLQLSALPEDHILDSESPHVQMFCGDECWVHQTLTQEGDGLVHIGIECLTRQVSWALAVERGPNDHIDTSHEGGQVHRKKHVVLNYPVDGPIHTQIIVNGLKQHYVRTVIQDIVQCRATEVVPSHGTHTQPGHPQLVQAEVTVQDCRVIYVLSYVEDKRVPNEEHLFLEHHLIIWVVLRPTHRPPPHVIYPGHHPTELNNLLFQLPKPCLLLGNLNAHNHLWSNRPETDARGRSVEDLITRHNMCLWNDDSPTYLHPATGSLTSIDLSICSPTLFLDYTWNVEEDQYGSNHYPLVLNGHFPAPDERSKK